MRTTAAVALAIACLVGVGTVPCSSPARAETVDLLLVLAADVSRSIDDGEFELQRKGYAAALVDPRVMRAIAGGRHHAIAITYFEWAGPTDQKTIVDWTVVRDEEGAAAVATTIFAAPRSFVSRTAIGATIDFAMERFAAAHIDGEKRVIDISGDGTSNSGRVVTDARDQAVAAGVTINGLAIINTQASPGYAYHTHPPGGLPKYFEDNVIGGSGAFLMQVENFDTFAEAITRKLVTELAGISPRQRLATHNPATGGISQWASVSSVP